MGYEKVTEEETNKFIKKSSVLDKNGKRFNPCVGAHKFGAHGVGLFLYFKFLKYMIVMTFLMSLLMIGPLTSNELGGYLDKKKKSQFDSSTLANQGGIAKNTTAADAESIKKR